MQRKIQVFEHQVLDIFSVCDNGSVIGKEIIDLLWKYNDENEQKYFIGVRNGVKFRNYVGVVQIGNLTIEILPKADKEKSKDFQTWQSVLLQMLKICKKVKVSSLTNANLSKRSYSVLDLYFELFLDELQILLHNGLFKKYAQAEGNVLALKGSINFSKNIQKNIVRKDRFYTNHQEYNYAHLINQILFRTLNILKRINLNKSISDRVSKLLFCMPVIDDYNITEKDFQKIVWNRKTAAYKDAINIARLIILNYSPDIKFGKEDLIAILFDMNLLWEEFVFTVLKKKLTSNYKIGFQNSQKFWSNKTIRPDIYIEKIDPSTNDVLDKFIIDTKWKIINYDQPSDDDLKQIFAYNAHWGSKNSLLLYPTSNSDYRHFSGGYHYKIDGVSHECTLGFLNVLKNRSLNIEFTDRIMLMLER